MKKKVILLIAATFLSKIIAFGKELILAYYYGAGSVSDIYLMAMTIPVVIFGFFSTGISSGFVPAYKKAIGDNFDKTKGNRFTNEVVSVLTLICIILILLYYSLNTIITNFFASGFSDLDKEITLKFSNIMVFAIIFSCITTVMTSFLQSNDKTSIIGLLSIPLNFVIAISIVVSFIFNNIYYLPFGYLFACIFQAVVFVIISRRCGYRFTFGLSFSDSNLRFFLSSIFLLTIGSSVNQINVLIDKMLASTVSVGGVASLEYGNKIFDLISGIFILSISTVQFPRLVDNSNNKDDLSACFNEGIESLTIFLIPISFALVLFSREIVTLVYARGAFGNEAVELTSPILVFYGIGLLAIGIREILSKLYYALGNMKTPVINAIVGVIFNIVLNFIFVRFMGIGGLALATSIAAILVSSILFFQIKSRISLKPKISFYLTIILLSGISSIICKAVIMLHLFSSYKIDTILGFACFAIVYLGGAFLFGVFDIRVIRRILKH